MVRKAVGAVRWNLKRVMDERDIGPTELARVLKIDVSNVTRWRQAEYLPQIHERRWIQIVNAINYICECRGNYRMLMDLGELVEFCSFEQRDFGIFDNQSASAQERKRTRTKNVFSDTHSDLGSDDKDSLTSYA